jgi:cobalt/nickel transport system permease protein
MAVEPYHRGTSAIHAWHPSCKLLGMGTLLLVGNAMSQWPYTLPVLGVVLGLVRLSRVPCHFFLRRSLYPGFLILAYTLAAPFTLGRDTLVRVHGLSLYAEGVNWALLTLGRFILSWLSVLTVLGTTPLPHILAVLGRLGLSPWLLDAIVLTLRYLQDFRDGAQRMRTAMRLRGDRQQVRHRIPWIGSLLIRSYEQAERIHQAMRLRGYRLGLSPPTLPPPTAADYWGAGGAIALGLGLLLTAKMYPVLGF